MQSAVLGALGVMMNAAGKKEHRRGYQTEAAPQGNHKRKSFVKRSTWLSGRGTLRTFVVATVIVVLDRTHVSSLLISEGLFNLAEVVLEPCQVRSLY